MFRLLLIALSPQRRALVPSSDGATKPAPAAMPAKKAEPAPAAVKRHLLSVLRDERALR